MKRNEIKDFAKWWMILGGTQILISVAAFLAISTLAWAPEVASFIVFFRRGIDISRFPATKMTERQLIGGLLLAVINGSLGVFAVVGATKMFRLKDYRFCRWNCVLAFLPFSLSVLGLSLGVFDVSGLIAIWLFMGSIWGLVVLRRPDVKAAFAINDHNEPPAVAEQLAPTEFYAMRQEHDGENSRPG